MKLIPAPEPRWTLHHPDWLAAVERLRSGTASGTFEAALLLPLIAHFEAAWSQLRQLALLADERVPVPGSWPLPIQHLAEFVLDDVVDAFRGAASEVIHLVPAGVGGDASPEDVIEEANRFERYLAVAGMAARAMPVGELMADTTVRVASVLAGWSAGVKPLLDPVTEALEARRYGAADGFGTAPGAGHVH